MNTPMTDGERQVPPDVWAMPHFQNWLQAQKTAGNRLDGFEPVFEFRVANGRFVFFWGAKVNVYVAAENRNKSNEVVMSRPDIMHVVLLHMSDKLRAVMVREFRSPASTPSGFILETPGGSSMKGSDPRGIAAEELHEETGLVIDQSRIVPVGSKQLMGTMSAHQAHVYAVELFDADMEAVRDELGRAHGNEEDSERTYVEVHDVTSLLRMQLTDWSTLGMIYAAADALNLSP